ncbi:hypothetical protein [Phreatobacter sp.]|uniref:hypothetical protein n=1 Tax=Phreatobacter sp. TaxID=1966341 RepID=UPI0025F2A042|nr:hypothetical protein [Phreatobacter sp.]
MKTTISTVAFVALLSSNALAQTPPATAPAPTPRATQAPAPTPSAPATNTSAGMVNGAALENGANSFTEGQAMERLREAGISSVTELKKDDNGIWRGRGQWQGRTVEVGLDFRGNISAR